MKTLCILHANCQADALVAALRLSPSFERSFEVRIFTNYTREPVDDDSLSRCGLFLYQYLADSWGELSSSSLLARLPSGCPSLCIPNPFFRACWPMWRNDPEMTCGDEYLDTLLDKGVEPKDALFLALRTPLGRKYDLPARIARTELWERDRASRTPVPYLDFLLEHYRKEPLFNTPNHPKARLMAHVASGVLRALGHQELDAEQASRVEDVHPECMLPIHPEVAALLNLPYAGKDTRYPVYGREMTHDEFVTRYLECRAARCPDFIAYLQL